MRHKVVTSATWFLQGVGDIRFRRNLRAKRLTISIRPGSGVRVTMPGLLPFKAAQDFVEQKRSWITEKVTELSAINVFFDNQSNYRTRDHLLRFYPEQRDNLFVKLAEGEIRIYYPDYLQVDDKSVQTAARQGIVLAFRRESHAYLPQRLKELAQKHNFKYNQLRIKNITSRWGSCSAKNNINLSIYLMKLPSELIDYILLHELTHTVHKNHGVNFWSQLQSITGNAREFSERVKKYKTGV